MLIIHDGYCHVYHTSNDGFSCLGVGDFSCTFFMQLCAFCNMWFVGYITVGPALVFFGREQSASISAKCEHQPQQKQKQQNRNTTSGCEHQQQHKQKQQCRNTTAGCEHQQQQKQKQQHRNTTARCEHQGQQKQKQQYRQNTQHINIIYSSVAISVKCLCSHHESVFAPFMFQLQFAAL